MDELQAWDSESTLVDLVALDGTALDAVLERLAGELEADDEAAPA